MPLYHSSAVTAHRLKISKTYLIELAKKGKIKPPPIKMEGSRAPLLFAPDARRIK